MKRILPMTEDMRELINDTVRQGFADNDPEEYSKIWVDQGATGRYIGEAHYCRFVFVSRTPYGVRAVYHAFLRRMDTPETGESKRAIKRDIQTNPHLHPELKQRLLKKLSRCSVREGGRGIRSADAMFCHLIRSMRTLDEAFEIRRRLSMYAYMPDLMRENLLYNLDNYEAALRD